MSRCLINMCLRLVVKTFIKCWDIRFADWTIHIRKSAVVHLHTSAGQRKSKGPFKGNIPSLCSNHTVWVLYKLILVLLYEWGDIRVVHEPFREVILGGWWIRSGCFHRPFFGDLAWHDVGEVDGCALARVDFEPLGNVIFPVEIKENYEGLK